MTRRPRFTLWQSRKSRKAQSSSASRVTAQNILGPEIFRGKAANNLKRRSGAKTRQFEIGCPLGALMRHLENQLCCVAKKLQHIGQAY